MKIILIVVVSLVIVGLGVGYYVFNIAELDPFRPMYVDNCGSCHGDQLEGTDQGPQLLAGSLSGGNDINALQNSVKNGHPSLGQPAFAGQLTDLDIKGIAIYVGERRMGQKFTQFQFDRDIELPQNIVVSEAHSFEIEPVIDGLSKLLFSIEPLPDGGLLLTEKERGLSIISADGVQSPLIEGTPKTGGSIDVLGIQYGSGWLLDVAIHPQYETNGWIYLHYTDLCDEECDGGLMDASMNRLDRGRIADGKWVDVETIWQAPHRFYEQTPDTGAGGRIAFDDQGHVYISVGIKSDDDGSRDATPQDLAKPYGKIHRLMANGEIPLDNPYAASQEFVKQTIWTYGHRSPQGLEWNPERKLVWNSEMGPRGGDEINELIGGRNYGWPYFSQGLEYSGSYVERHKDKAIEFDVSSIERTLVDITPSPAISSFTFYSGKMFPNWHNNVLIGSLKGSSLYRFVFDGNKLLHKETLLSDLARIRDIEVGFDGLVYLLLENEAGGQIVRLTPVGEQLAQN